MLHSVSRVGGRAVGEGAGARLEPTPLCPVPCGLFRPVPPCRCCCFGNGLATRETKDARGLQSSFFFSFVAVGEFDSYPALVTGFSRQGLSVCCHERSKGTCHDHFSMERRANAFFSSSFVVGEGRLLNHPAFYGFSRRLMGVFSQALLSEKEARWWCKAPICRANGRWGKDRDVVGKNLFRLLNLLLACVFCWVLVLENGGVAVRVAHETNVGVVFMAAVDLLMVKVEVSI